MPGSQYHAQMNRRRWRRVRGTRCICHIQPLMGDAAGSVENSG